MKNSFYLKENILLARLIKFLFKRLIKWLRSMHLTRKDEYSE